MTGNQAGQTTPQMTAVTSHCTKGWHWNHGMLEWCIAGKPSGGWPWGLGSWGYMA